VQPQTTDANGHYQFTQIVPGVYTITESPPIGLFLGALQNGSPPAASTSQLPPQFRNIDFTTAPFTSGYNFSHLVAGFPVSVTPQGTTLPLVATTFTGKIQLLGSGPINNLVFVNALYQQVLARAPDAIGLNTWVYLLDIGVSR